MATFTLNGDSVTVEAEPDAPLLWVVREHLGLTGTKFGCGAYTRIVRAIERAAEEVGNEA